MNAMVFERFLDAVRVDGLPLLSPSKLAEKLAVPVQEFADWAGVHRNTLRLHPESIQVQEFTRGVLRVLSAAAEINPDIDRTVFWYMNAPIPSFRHKTACQLVVEKRADDVVNYLESIKSGYVG